MKPRRKTPETMKAPDLFLEGLTQTFDKVTGERISYGWEIVPEPDSIQDEPLIDLSGVFDQQLSLF